MHAFNVWQRPSCFGRCFFHLLFFLPYSTIITGKAPPSLCSLLELSGGFCHRSFFVGHRPAPLSILAGWASCQTGLRGAEGTTKTGDARPQTPIILTWNWQIHTKKWYNSNGNKGLCLMWGNASVDPLFFMESEQSGSFFVVQCICNVCTMCYTKIIALMRELRGGSLFCRWKDIAKFVHNYDMNWFVSSERSDCFIALTGIISHSSYSFRNIIWTRHLLGVHIITACAKTMG